MTSHIPNEFLCPISMELMEDPVLCADGQTYERRQIVEWLQRSSTSPMTRQPLSLHTMIPNYALKASIERWKNMRSASALSPAPAPAAPPYVPVPPAPLYTPPVQNPSYTMVQMPYVPPPMYPSYQQQTVQSHMSIVPAVQMQRQQQQQLPQQQQPNPIARRLTVGLCLILFIVSIISSIIYSQEMNRHKQQNNDDDN